MGGQLIKQPNGLYTEYCRWKKSIVSCNHTRESIIAKEVDKFKEHLNDVIDIVDRGEDVTMNPITFKQALEITKENHPEDFEKIVAMLTS